MAHVGDELRFVLAGDLKLVALARDLIEQARVLQCDDGLVGERLHQADNIRGELAGATTPKDERSKWSLRAEQCDYERCAKSGCNHRVSQGIARTLHKVRNLQWLSLGDRLPQSCLSRRNVEPA